MLFRSTGVTSYLNNLVNKGIIYQFAFEYSDKNREELLKYTDYDSLLKYLKSQNLVDKVADFASKKGVKRRPVYINISRGIIERQATSYIMRNIQGEDSFYKQFFSDDNTLNKAIDILSKGEAFPSIAASNDTEIANNDISYNISTISDDDEEIAVDSISDFGD